MPKKLTAKHYRAIESLLTKGIVTEAATAAGVSRDTLYRWLKDDTFRQALTEAESEALQTLSRSLVAMGEDASKALRDAMTGKEVPTGAKLRAVDIVLGRLMQLRELINLEERVAEIERRLRGDNPKTPD